MISTSVLFVLVPLGGCSGLLLTEIGSVVVRCLGSLRYRHRRRPVNSFQLAAKLLE